MTFYDETITGTPKRPRAKKAPRWATAGATVLYQPSELAPDVWYRGTIDGPPFLLGETWCARLTGMPEAYGKHAVKAAALNRCRKAGSRDLDWEDRRGTLQVKLRLTEADAKALRACASRAGEDVSECVARLVAEEGARIEKKNKKGA
jgi:hypothetical protein